MNKNRLPHTKHNIQADKYNRNGIYQMKVPKVCTKIHRTDRKNMTLSETTRIPDIEATY
jgi:hypothetical protein